MTNLYLDYPPEERTLRQFLDMARGQLELLPSDTLEKAQEIIRKAEIELDAMIDQRIATQMAYAKYKNTLSNLGKHPSVLIVDDIHAVEQASALEEQYWVEDEQLEEAFKCEVHASKSWRKTHLHQTQEQREDGKANEKMLRELRADAKSG